MKLRCNDLLNKVFGIKLWPLGHSFESSYRHCLKKWVVMKLSPKCALPYKIFNKATKCYFFPQIISGSSPARIFTVNLHDLTDYFF